MRTTIFLLIICSTFLIAQDIKYVGNSSCKMCHKKVEKGAQYAVWEKSTHSQSYETLKSENAINIAKEKGFETDPWLTPECLICHTTGYNKGGYAIMDDSFWNPADDDKAGKKAVKKMKGLQNVGCESCHGAGSAYKSKKKMISIYNGEIEGSTVGLTNITEETCIVCHNEDSPTFKPFNFEERTEKIAHPIP